jgi:hypothetical protein
MKREVALGESIEIKFEGTRPFFTSKDGKEVILPIGATLFFKSRFLVRRARAYEYPSCVFWTVTVEEREGELGLLLPEGDEESSFHVEGKNGKIEKKTSLLHHKPTFVPLHRVCDGFAEVVSLP